MSTTRRPSRRPARWIPVLAVLLLAPAGCGDDSSTGPDGGNTEGSELAGTWNVTSFTADGVDGIDAGMTVSITFDVTGSTAPAFRGATGTFTVQIENDTLELCEGQTSCTPTGAFEVQGSSLIFDPGTQDELVWTYWVDGTTMGMSATIDVTAVQVVAQR